MAETSVRLMQCVVASEGVLKIESIGVGVGVIIYSSFQKKGAGIHILAAKSETPTPDNPAKYANTAIPYAIDELKKNGANPPFSVAIAGGGAMLQGASSMGLKNVEAVKDALKQAGLSIKLERTGGSGIRSVVLDLEAGKLKIS